MGLTTMIKNYLIFILALAMFMKHGNRLTANCSTLEIHNAFFIHDVGLFSEINSCISKETAV